MGIYEFINDSGELTLFHGIFHDDNLTETGCYYHFNGKPWAWSNNLTWIDDPENGSKKVDQDRLDLLVVDWPFPDVLMMIAESK